MKKDFHFQLGFHAVASLLAHAPYRIQKIILQKEREDDRAQQIIADASEHQIAIEHWNKNSFKQQFGNSRHQGIVAVCLPPQALDENDLDDILKQLTTDPFLLLLDGVQDPQNLGACMRSANAAGINAVIIAKNRAVGLTETVSKVSCGAAETLPLIQVSNLVQTMSRLKKAGIWLYGGAAEATSSLYQTDLRGPLGLVLGAEEKGLKRLTRETCDGLWSIPMHGTVASLNISVACGISLFEATRQRDI